MCSMVVPVYLSHCDSPDNERLVYALLDTQSDTTFILDRTYDALGMSGVGLNWLCQLCLLKTRLLVVTK
jgi:hypothetical protein